MKIDCLIVGFCLGVLIASALAEVDGKPGWFVVTLFAAAAAGGLVELVARAREARRG